MSDSTERHSLRWWGQALVPPIIVIGVKRALRPLLGRTRSAPIASPEPEVREAPPEWEYVPEGFARRVRGWDAAGVAAAYARKWPAYLRSLEGPRPLTMFHEAPEGDPLAEHYRPAQEMLLAFAYVAALASVGRDRLRVLDWGGGLGHYAPLARALLPGVELAWTCREVPAVAEVGRTVQPDVEFVTDDSCLERRYDLVLVSGSIQYAEDWPGLLGRLAAATEGRLFVTRLPVALEGPSFVVLQRAERYGYDTEYVGWVLNRDALLAAAVAAHVELEREFLLDMWLSAAGAPESPVGHRGFLFRPSDARPGPGILQG